jgi:hypothetical protein
MAALLMAIIHPRPAEARKYPRIFESIELCSKKTSRFPKWLGTLDRFQDGRNAADGLSRF